MSYKAKFLSIGLMVVLFTGFLTYKSYSTISESVAFSQKELAGAKLLSPIKSLLIETQKLRGTTASYLSGNSAANSKIDTLKESVLSKLQIVKNTVKDSEISGVSQKVAEIESALQTHMSQATSMGLKPSFAKYTDIVNKELDLIVYIGDNSNLILDPDIDSFYMMDAVINKLPQMFENTGKSRGLSAAVASRGKIETDEMISLISLTDSAKKDLHGLESGFSSAYAVNPSLKELLEGKKNTLLKRFELFKKDVDERVIHAQTIDSSAIFAEGTDVIGAADALYKDALSSLTKLLEVRVDSLTSKETTLLVEAGLFSLLLWAVFIAFYHSVSGAVNSVVSQLKEIEESKDLSRDIQIDTKDELLEIAKAYNSFRGSIHETMRNALHSVNNSTQEATTMLKSSQEISKNSQDMSSVISQMAEKGELIKEELASSKELAQNSKEQITVAYDTLQSATESIQNLASQVEESSHKEMEMADKINQLSQDANDVKSVLHVINDIAEQTNLLALNAAIEAARAGEHGRGFAVVADEVRQLAEKTQKSLSEINATINVIMQNINEASTEMNQNAQDISAMTETSESVLKEVEWVNTIMDEATKLIDESAQSIEKNAEGVETIAKDLQSTNQLSESNNVKVDSISTGSTTLAGRVGEIKERMGIFSL